MKNDMTSFVERYQLIYEKDPTSKVFAPLAEAYRRMGLLDEAIDLAENGVKIHPHFSSGRVALGKCYVQKGKFEKAIEELKIAVEISPENILAHQLIAECYTKMNKNADALQAYKMLLFLNPRDEKAAQWVKTLETQIYTGSKGASVPDDEDFSMEKLKEVQARRIPHQKSNSEAAKPTSNKERRLQLDFEQALALLDTRFDRGDWQAARTELNILLKKYPQNAELLKRQAHINELTDNSFNFETISPLEREEDERKIGILQNLLSRVESRRKS